ncbi:MAG: energy transducer TonB, partial [Pyrinomonadaceae bacterium]|nr:energy transducer TonB [Pyrinomonadaceae bacterium]
PVVAAAEPEVLAAEPEIVPEVAEPVVEAVAPKAIPVAAPVYTQPTTVDVDRKPVSLSDERDKAINEGGFYVTVIEEKNAGQRSALLLGSTVFILILALGSTVFSLFQKDIGIGAIGDENSLASLIDEVPMITEEEKQQEKDKNAGGGGGGGREEEETTKGDLANQTPNPQRPPQAIPRMENPSLVLPPASTQGNKQFEQKYDRFGDPNGRFTNFNNGTGSGGGQGSGSGTGQGSGVGTGAGSGSGSGYGSGLGNGNGSGTGDGDGGGGPPPRAVGVTQGIKILSKPRPGYTDSARQNNITGTVILRVTFLASGQVGSISPVKGLGNGLTEQAIAAARRISFEPAKTNGVPQSVTKQIEYTFSIY